MSEWEGDRGGEGRGGSLEHAADARRSGQPDPAHPAPPHAPWPARPLLPIPSGPALPSRTRVGGRLSGCCVQVMRGEERGRGGVEWEEAAGAGRPGWGPGEERRSIVGPQRPERTRLPGCWSEWNIGI